jgi:hypothetical protein
MQSFFKETFCLRWAANMPDCPLTLFARPGAKLSNVEATFLAWVSADVVCSSIASSEEARRFRVLHQTREQTRTIYFAIIVTIFLVRGSMIRTWPCSSA